MTASEQKRIEFFAPAYLRHGVIILVEMGLRPYKELFPMRKDQVDLDNGIVHIPDSKTKNGIADMPMTEPAWQAFRERFAERRAQNTCSRAQVHGRRSHTSGA
jgi:integrase